jgi:hypothetical protein
MADLTVDVTPVPGVDARLRVRCELEARESAPLRLAPSSPPDPRRGSCAGIEGLSVAGRKTRAGEELNPRAGVLQYFYDVLMPHLDPDRANLLAGFAWEGVAWATLASVILMPEPRPPRMTVRLGLCDGLVVPGERGPLSSEGAAKLRERDLLRTFVLWGDFEADRGFYAPRGRPALPPDLREEIAALRSALERSFTFEAFGDVAHVVLPILPPIGAGGFAGAGLAGRGCVLLFLPENFPAMDRLGLLWLVSHELAHLWLGVSVRAGEAGLDWFIEGLAAYYALLAMRRTKAADDTFLVRMLAVSLGRLACAAEEGRGGERGGANTVMHEGLIFAMLVNSELRAAGGTTLEKAVAELVRDCHDNGEDLTTHSIREALEETGSAFAKRALERRSRGGGLLPPDDVGRLHSLIRDLPASGIPQEIRELIESISG